VDAYVVLASWLLELSRSLASNVSENWIRTFCLAPSYSGGYDDFFGAMCVHTLCPLLPVSTPCVGVIAVGIIVAGTVTVRDLAV